MSSKSQNKAATTVKVAGQTGAAKDDIFAGFSEDNATQILNVLANDPGSAYLWSLDQNALNAPAGSQLPQNLSSVVLASGATLTANANGTVTYTGGAGLQSLRAGEIGTDSFVYVIRMANGALSTARAEVQITGVNDAATFGGDLSGGLTEDDQSVAGQLIVSDVDRDESSMQAASLNGDFGSLNIATDGGWLYSLTSDMNRLRAGETVTEQFTVLALDGTTQAIDITIAGVNDVAVFSGTATGSVQEDATGSTGGTLLVSDVDTDEAAFAGTGSLQGNFGSFSFDLDTGAWTYALNNDSVAVQSLATGDSAQDSLEVFSVDGSSTFITVDIAGTDEVVVDPEPEIGEIWKVNRQNLLKQGSGLQERLEWVGNTGYATIDDFAADDMLGYVNSMLLAGVDVDDLNNDGVDDTTVLFRFTQGLNTTRYVAVQLLGFADFDTGQNLFQFSEGVPSPI